MPVSDPEKGVSVLGCHLREKEEHVPIKKRRFLLRNLSPPSPQPPPQSAISSQPTEEIADQFNGQHASNELAAKETGSSNMNLSQNPDDNIKNHAEKFEKPIKKFGGEDDFSGILILAAAACSSSLGKNSADVEDGSCLEECSTQNQANDKSVGIEEHSSRGVLKEDIVHSSEMSTGGTSSCVSMKPVAQFASISTSVNSCQNAECVGEGMKDAASVSGYLTLSSDVCSKDEETVGNQKPASQVDRFHWDLNVVMDDDSEVPLGDSFTHNDVPHNISQNGGKHNHDDISHNADAHCKPSFPVSLDNTPLLSNCNNDLDVGKYVDEATNMHHQESVNNADGLVHTTSDHASQLSASGSMKEVEDVSAKSPTMEGLSLHAVVSPCTQDGSGSIDIPATTCVSSVNDIGMQVTPTLMDNLETSQRLHNHIAVEGEVNLNTVGNVNGMSNEMDIRHSSCGKDLKSISPKCEDSATLQDVSDAPGGGMLVCNNDTLPNIFGVDPVVNKDTCDIVDHYACEANVDENLVCSDKIDSAQPRDDCDVDSNCHPVSAMGSYRTSDPLEDNGSQYEDGELIETVEHVNNVHDDMEICGSSPIHCQVSESEQVGAKEKKNNVGIEVVPVISSDVGCFGNEGIMKSTNNVEEKTKAPRNDLLESGKCMSGVGTRVKVGGGRNGTMTSHGDGLLESEGTATRLEHSKTYGRGLRSQIEGPITRDVSSKDERLNRMENRYGESSSARPYERVRYPFNNKARGQHGDSWGGSIDGRRGFKRHYSPIRRAPKLEDDGIMERDGIRIVDTLNDASYSHRVILKGQSGTHEDSFADLHSRSKPDRKFSPDRAVQFGRGRPFRYGPSVDSRVGRVRCNRPSPDDSFQSSLKYRRPLSCRERSFSPFGRRGLSNAYHSRGKSPSRSRSRSPTNTMWQSPRGRFGVGSSGNDFYRHRNRSPDFRSEGRVQRVRSPHHQPGSVADHAMGVRPNASNRVSPLHNRWTSDRKDEICHFREYGYKQRFSGLEKSSGRLHMRGSRADAIDSPRNMKLDGQFRISEDTAGRGFSHEENYEDRRKQYGPLRSIRPNYEDGMPHRSNLDVNDGFPANHIRERDSSNFEGRGFRGVRGRIGDVRQRLRGEQHSFMYERDGKLNSSSKKLGIDAMDSPSNWQSEDQYDTHVYRPIRRRYENYEGREKQYGVGFRHPGMGPTGKRLNYNVDESFQDGPDFHGRGMKNLDYQNNSVSTRSEDHKAVVCEQEEKLNDNPQSVGAQNSNDNDN